MAKDTLVTGHADLKSNTGQAMLGVKQNQNGIFRPLVWIGS